MSQTSDPLLPGTRYVMKNKKKRGCRGHPDSMVRALPLQSHGPCRPFSSSADACCAAAHTVRVAQLPVIPRPRTPLHLHATASKSVHEYSSMRQLVLGLCAVTLGLCAVTRGLAWRLHLRRRPVDYASIPAPPLTVPCLSLSQAPQPTCVRRSHPSS